MAMGECSDIELEHPLNTLGSDAKRRWVFLAHFLTIVTGSLFWDILFFGGEGMVTQSWKFSLLWEVYWQSIQYISQCSGSSRGGHTPRIPTVIPRWCQSLTLVPTSLCLMPPLPKQLQKLKQAVHLLQLVLVLVVDSFKAEHIKHFSFQSCHGFSFET